MSCTVIHWTRLPISLIALATPLAAQAQAPALGAAWDSVARILQAPGAPTGGFYRYNLPRRDITLRIGDVTVSPSLALGAWAGFSGDPAAATMMGDLVVTGSELKPVQAALAGQGIEITAVHNHLVGGTPEITYIHFHAEGVATRLAARLDSAIARTGTPRPVASPPPPALSVDTALVFRTLGATGRAQGSVAQVSFILVPGEVTMGGHVVTPALGYGSPINLQMVDPSRAVATGDLAVPGHAVDPVLDAFAQHGITTTAVHSHLIDERPAVYYIHFWADGPVADVLAGLRAAVDAARR